jgi:hypothetical protein
MVQSQPPDVNVLPVGYRPRRLTARTVVAAVALTVLVAGLIPLYAALIDHKKQTGRVADRLSVVQGALAAYQGQQAGLLETEERISEVQSEIAGLTEEFGAIGQERAPRADSVEAAVAYLVPRVQIQSIVQMGNLVVVTGEAGSQALVLDYSGALLSSGEFVNVRILSMVNADPLGIAPDVTFSVALEG